MDSSPSHIQTVSNRTSMPSRRHDMLKHSETNLAEINLVKRHADKISHCFLFFFSFIDLPPIGHLMTAYQTADCERSHILVVLKDELTTLLIP